MLNAGVLLRDGGGRIRNTPNGPADAFNAGVPTRAGLLLTAAVVPVVFTNGNPLAATGALCAQAAAIAGFGPGGLPLTAAGLVVIDTATPIDHYVAGLPVTAGGALCFAAAE